MLFQVLAHRTVQVPEPLVEDARKSSWCGPGASFTSANLCLRPRLPATDSPPLRSAVMAHGRRSTVTLLFAAIDIDRLRDQSSCSSVGFVRGPSKTMTG